MRCPSPTRTPEAKLPNNLPIAWEYYVFMYCSIMYYSKWQSASLIPRKMVLFYKSMKLCRQYNNSFRFFTEKSAKQRCLFGQSVECVKTLQTF